MTEFYDDISLDTGDGLLLGADEISLTPDPGQAQSPQGLRGVDIEAEAAAEVTEVLAGFKNRAKREDQRFTDATDSEFWIAVCFQTREQKEEFLQKLDLLQYGDKYLDGMLVAAQLGVTLDSRIPPLPQHNLDPRLLRLT